MFQVISEVEDSDLPNTTDDESQKRTLSQRSSSSDTEQTQPAKKHNLMTEMPNDDAPNSEWYKYIILQITSVDRKLT